MMLNVQSDIDMSYLLSKFDPSPECREMYLKMGCSDVLERIMIERQQWLKLCHYATEHGLAGMVLQHSDSSRWSFLTPDPEPGYHRYTCFDYRGFFAHGQYVKLEDALYAAFQMGYRILAAPDTLKQVSASSEWTVT